MKRIRNTIGWTILGLIVLKWLYDIITDDYIHHGWNVLWIFPLEVAGVYCFIWLMNILLD